MKGAPTPTDELTVLERALANARKRINDVTGVTDAMLERKRPRQSGEADGADTRVLRGGEGEDPKRFTEPAKLTAPNEGVTKMFRCFDIIAAVAYAAHRASFGDSTAPTWDELSETEQNLEVQAVMAIKRGERDERVVYAATAQAIFGFNNGQGALALEKLSQLGAIPFDLELVTEADVAGRDIAEVISGLLNELAERRSGMDHIAKRHPRWEALELAVRLAPHEGIVPAAEAFAQYIADDQGELDGCKLDALDLASRGDGSITARETPTAELIRIAGTYEEFLRPQPIPAAVLEEREEAVVQ